MKKTTLRLLTALLAMLLVLMAFSACGTVTKAPDRAVLDAIDTTEKLAAKNEAAKKMEAYEEFNSVEFNINLSDLIGSVATAASGGTVGISLTSQLELNMKAIGGETAGFAALTLLLNGTDFADVDLHITEEKIALASEALLGNTAYGASLKSLLEMLKAQEEQAPEGVIPDFEYPETPSMSVDELLATLKKSNEQTEALSAVLEKYKTVVIEAIFESAVSTQTEETVTVNGESAKAVVFTARMNEENALAVLNSVYTTYKNDAETRATLEDFAKAYGATDADIAAFYTTLETELAKAPETDNDFVDLRFVIGKKKGNLIAVSLIDEDDTVTLTLGLDPEDPTYFAFEVEDDFSLVCRVTENTKEAYAAEITATDEGKTAFAMSLTHDKTTDQYTANLSADNTVITVSGAFKAEKNALTLGFSEISVKAQGQTVTIKPSMTMTFKKGTEQLPAMPEYTDITTMTEKDFAEFAAELEAKLTTLLSMLPADLQMFIGSMMGGGM